MNKNTQKIKAGSKWNWKKQKLKTAATVCVHQNLYASSLPLRLLFLLTDYLRNPPRHRNKEERSEGGASKTVCLMARPPTRSGFWNFWLRHAGLDRSLIHIPPPLPGPMHCSLMHAVLPMMHFSLALPTSSSHSPSPPSPSPFPQLKFIEKQSMRCARKKNKQTNKKRKWDKHTEDVRLVNKVHEIDFFILYNRCRQKNTQKNYNVKVTWCRLFSPFSGSASSSMFFPWGCVQYFLCCFLPHLDRKRRRKLTFSHWK